MHLQLILQVRITATCIRVPVMRAHAESINLEFERDISEEEAVAALSKAKGVSIINDRANNRWAGGRAAAVACQGSWAQQVKAVQYKGLHPVTAVHQAGHGELGASHLCMSICSLVSTVPGLHLGWRPVTHIHMWCMGAVYSTSNACPCMNISSVQVPHSPGCHHP
jgi:hypothetical protein